VSLDEKRNKILRSTGEPMVKKLLCVCWIAVVLTGYVNARNPGSVQTAREFPDAQPPNGCTMEENWSLEDAWQETTPTRAIVSLNGLWKFFPVTTPETGRMIPPRNSGWGFFKVPGIWPGMGNRKTQPGNSSAFYGLNSERFAGLNPSALTSAWYRRTMKIPRSWNGKKIELEITMLQTGGRIFIDGKKAGDMFFPGGRLDITESVVPGKEHELVILVSAIASRTGDSVFMAPDRAHKAARIISNRGITGDVYLRAEPQGEAITDSHIITSYRRKTITFDTGIVRGDGEYYIEADISWKGRIVKRMKSELFQMRSTNRPGRFRFSGNWIARNLWDTDTPEHIYTANIRLKNKDGVTLDEFLPQSFGFREFWIDGRNFMLNGSVIHLRSLCSSAMRDGAAHSSAKTAALFARRAKENGFNHLIAYNYFFTPGIVGYQDDFYLQSSKAGVLTSLTLPHIKDFEWDLKKNEARYLEMAEFLIRRFQNVPGIVMYAVNHNATGYYGDQNPKKIDGVYAPDPFMEKAGVIDCKNRAQASLSADLIKRLDDSRPVYHHESGNLGEIFSINCYLNWVPAQERSDWFAHWELNGRKPLMLVEWGNPHIASWTSYRGPGFLWRDKGVQCMWFNEYNAAILGETAYRTSERKELRYRRQTRISASNKPIHYAEIGSFSPDEDADDVIAEMVKRNYRDMRARGVSAILPWDQAKFWKCEKEAGERISPDRFSHLKRPGIVPDYTRSGGGYLIDADGSYKISKVGKAGLPYMKELLAWIAGGKGDMTGRSCTFYPGENVGKQIVILNDSRRTRKAEVRWDVPELGMTERCEVTLQPGTRADVPVNFRIPQKFRKDTLAINAAVRFDNGTEVSDAFKISLIPRSASHLQSRVGLYDPEKQSEAVIRKLKIPFRTVTDNPDLTGIQLLVIGRRALPECPLNLADFMKNGGKLLVLEQDSACLTQLGFRSNEYGIRTVFPLVADFSAKTIHDWRGSATLTAPYLTLPDWERHDPTWNWLGFVNTRAWKAGNRGNVCSIPLEKASIGNFLPLMQCGFDLQYSPALEARHGNGIAIFSQFDFSGRTQDDPEACELLRKLISRLDSSRIQPVRKTWFSGGTNAETLLREIGIDFQKCTAVPESGLLVVSSGTELSDLTDAVKQGLNVFGLALSKEELAGLFPGKFRVENRAGFSDFVARLNEVPEFRGISNSDLHYRTELTFAGFTGGSNGGTAMQSIRIGKGTVVILQVAPWMLRETDFQFRTSRRRNVFLISRLLHNLGAADRYCAWDRLNLKNNRLQTRKHTVKIFCSQRGPAGSNGNTEFSGCFDIPPEILKNSGKAVLAVSSPSASLTVEINGRIISETSVNMAGNKKGISRRFVFEKDILTERNNSIRILQRKTKTSEAGRLTIPLFMAPKNRFYWDIPISSDDPYRYYRW